VPRLANYTYKPICTVEDLKMHLQWAATLELSTLPPYLCALYSMQDNSSEAFQIVRSVAIEEMLHLNLASNLLNSIGASPVLTGSEVPTYPTSLLHHSAGGPFIQLMACSTALMRDVFMAIEKPEASPHAPPEGDHYQTIGQFYKAIEDGFVCCVERLGEKAVFGHDTGFQRTDLYIGSGGGETLRVCDLKTARQAIQEIVEQGEGAEASAPPVPGAEPYGGYEHYGLRSDGTYGPILGVPWEMSHYYKFEALADGRIPIPAAYPMKPNPSTQELDGRVKLLSAIFNDCYSLILRSLQLTFGADVEPSPFFTLGFPVMHGVLPPLAKLLMQTPVLPEASADLGPTAGPSFEYNDTPLREVQDRCTRLADDHPAWSETLLQVHTKLAAASEKLGGVNIDFTAS
jgi:hypothetical protein